MAIGGYIGLARMHRRIMHTVVTLRESPQAIYTSDRVIEGGMFGDMADAAIGQAILEVVGKVCGVEGATPDQLTITITFE